MVRVATSVYRKLFVLVAKILALRVCIYIYIYLKFQFRQGFNTVDKNDIKIIKNEITIYIYNTVIFIFVCHYLNQHC